ncbi:MAG: hypothetical protein E7282_07790 [Lachnospiraceae bacterium]|nr:hypothetical protein [Lachnospiraceae bacterium]
MNIIQTINCGTDKSQLEKYFKILQELKIRHLRFNLCKYSEDVFTVIDNIFYAINNVFTGDVNLYFDLPYPRNKTRIIEYSIPDGQINKNQFYNIYAKNSKSERLNDNEYIVMDIESFEKKNLTVGKVIYFGDGQGSFFVEEIANQLIVVRAITDFKIYYNKAITIGLKEMTLPDQMIEYILGKFKVSVTFFLSFLENKQELEILRAKYDSTYTFIPKIEYVKNKINLSEVIDSANGVMIARGDLFLLNSFRNAIEYYDLICDECTTNNKDIYVATDVMKSLVNRAFPSRADIIDIVQAKKMGAAYIILSFSKLPVLIKTINTVKEILESE